MSDFLKWLNELLKTVSANKKAGLWLIGFLIVGAGIWFGSKLLFPESKKPGECDYLMEQNRQLVNALLGIKKDVDSISEGRPVSYKWDNQTYIMWAVFDTVPKKTNAKQELKKVSSKIDSIIIKNQKYLDSVNKTKTHQKKS